MTQKTNKGIGQFFGPMTQKALKFAKPPTFEELVGPTKTIGGGLLKGVYRPIELGATLLNYPLAYTAGTIGDVASDVGDIASGVGDILMTPEEQAIEYIFPKTYQTQKAASQARRGRSFDEVEQIDSRLRNNLNLKDDEKSRRKSPTEAGIKTDAVKKQRIEQEEQEEQEAQRNIDKRLRELQESQISGGKKQTDSGTKTDAGTKKDEETQNPYAQMLADSIDAYNNILTGETQPRKSIEDYKKDFEKATGIDASGKVDKSSALMAFGLAAMQNKAGRDFNVSNVLAGFGEAGEKALPALEKAKDRARAGQLAAGQFALQEQKADTARQLDAAKLKIDKISELQKQATDYQQSLELENIKQKNRLAVEELKSKNEQQKKSLEKGGFDFVKPTDTKMIENQDFFTVKQAYDKNGNQMYFADEITDINKLGVGYGNVLQAEALIDKGIDLIDEIQNAPEGPALKQILDAGFSSLKALGFGELDPSRFKAGSIQLRDGSFVAQEGITKKEALLAIQKQLISEYKRFLTKETGNGISNTDVIAIEELLGKLNLLTNPDAAKNRLYRVREIFAPVKMNFENAFEFMSDKSKYVSEERFNRAQTELQKILIGQSGGLITNVTQENGRLVFDAR